MTRKSRLLLSFMLAICLSGASLALKVGYFGTVHLSSNCSIQQKNVLGPAVLFVIFYTTILLCLVLDIHWAFSCLTRNKNKNENSGISSSLFLGLQHIWAVLLGQFQDLG